MMQSGYFLFLVLIGVLVSLTFAEEIQSNFEALVDADSQNQNVEDSPRVARAFYGGGYGRGFGFGGYRGGYGYRGFGGGYPGFGYRRYGYGGYGYGGYRRYGYGGFYEENKKNK
uniref:Uncharacterized protein n=1 Tax=Megaselia scalaris TaxID=36166 RepID=T1GH43_MEGSC